MSDLTEDWKASIQALTNEDVAALITVFKRMEDLGHVEPGSLDDHLEYMENILLERDA